jgi:polar amino acid transport system substrate-binding protein
MLNLFMKYRLFVIVAGCLLCSGFISKPLSSIDDLKDKRIGVLMGSVHDRYANKTYPQASILQYKSPSDLMLGVKSGKIDAAIYSYDELMQLLSHHDDLAIIGDALFSTPIGMGFHRDNNDLRLEFNRFLKHIRSNGQYDAMIRHWMNDRAVDMPEIQKSSSGKPLVVGIVSDNGLPFNVVINNRMVGFGIELLERFALYSGRQITYRDLEFSNQIAALESKKIDMSAAVMSITEERKKQIAFSDPYYDQAANMFALKKNIAVKTAGPKTMQKNVSVSFFAGIINSFQSNIVQENRYLLILGGLKTTVIISVLATLFGTLLGAVVCFMRMSSSVILNLLAKTYIAILRGTPVLVFLMLIFYVVFASVNIDPVFVSVIAFGMNFAAYVAEIFRSGIESIDKGQSEAGIAMGFTKVNTFLFIVLPQTVQRILPVYKGEFISLVKMTSIVGYIAVQDLTKASDIIRSRTFDAFFPLIMVAVLYFLISWFLMLLMEYAERLTNPKLNRKKILIA